MPVSVQKGPCIGIIADSHGDASAIRAALALLSPVCERIYHLGDVCDSLLPDTADACISAIQAHGVRALKGNNDHVLVVNRQDRGEGRPRLPGVSQKSIAYLAHLPYLREFRNGCFTHSLPFEKDLGPGCMLGRLTRDHADRWCRQNRGRILFRGHSHAPEIRWLQNGRMQQKTLHPGSRVELGRHLPCIITCGALTEGVFMTWQPDTETLICSQLETPLATDAA